MFLKHQNIFLVLEVRVGDDDEDSDEGVLYRLFFRVLAEVAANGGGL